MPPAPDDSLEALALRVRSDDVAFLDAKALRAAGRCAARGIADDIERLEWSQRIDGLLVLREDRPVTLL